MIADGYENHDNHINYNSANTEVKLLIHFSVVRSFLTTLINLKILPFCHNL